MTAHRSFFLSGIALAASLACMPSHAGWLSDLLKKDGGGAAYYEDSGWGDAAGTSTAVAPTMTSTTTATSPTPAERPTLTARPARTVADSTGSVALTGVTKKWEAPINEIKNNVTNVTNNFNNINAKVDGMGAGKSWVHHFKGQEKCETLYKGGFCFKMPTDEHQFFSLSRWGRSNNFLVANQLPQDYRPIAVFGVPPGCNSSGHLYFLEPAGYNLYTGSPPTDWSLRFQGYEMDNSACVYGGG